MGAVFGEYPHNLRNVQRNKGEPEGQLKIQPNKPEKAVGVQRWRKHQLNDLAELKEKCETNSYQYVNRWRTLQVLWLLRIMQKG